jgi:hypothetical protein
MATTLLGMQVHSWCCLEDLRAPNGTIEAKWLQVLMKVSLGHPLAEAGGPRLADGHTIPGFDSSQRL